MSPRKGKFREAQESKPAPAKALRQGSKTALSLLRSKNGVPLDELVKKIWQKHTVRGFKSLAGRRRLPGEAEDCRTARWGVPALAVIQWLNYFGCLRLKEWWELLDRYWSVRV